MKRQNTARRWLAGVLAAVLLCALLPACGKRGEAPPAPASSAVQAESAPSSAAGQSEPGTPPQDPPGQTSAPENVNRPEEEGQIGPVIDIETDSPDFDEKFKQNPLDAAYVQESVDAVSNQDMIALSEKYAALWETEINAGMEKLLALASDDKELYRKQQEDWETGKEENLQKIAAQAGQGSLAAVSAASEKMDFFRTRANQVLRELYSYDPDFDYAYGALG